MKVLTRPAFAGLLFAGVLLTGCASAPTQEFEAAQQALQAAQTAEANLYVADLYEAAQDSMTAAQVEIESQEGKFALSRNYDRATQLLQYVTETATTATAAVDERKAALQTETEQLIVQAQDALASVQDLLARAPSGKEGRIALVAISEDSGTAQTMLNDAQAALQNGEIMHARELAQSALDKANQLTTELTQAINKTQNS